MGVCMSFLETRNSALRLWETHLQDVWWDHQWPCINHMDSLGFHTWGGPQNGSKWLVSNGKSDENGWFGGTMVRKPPYESWGFPTPAVGSTWQQCWPRMCSTPNSWQNRCQKYVENDRFRSGSSIVFLYVPKKMGICRDVHLKSTLQWISGSRVDHEWITSGSRVDHEWITSGSRVDHEWILWA